MSDLEPITRDEVAWSNGDLEPITRKEKYIKHLYDETQEIPDPPQTREEWFIKKAGEEIHDVAIEPLTATQNGTYSESGKAYSPVTVALPLGSKSVTANGAYNASDDSLEGYSSVSVDVPLPDNAYLKKDLPTGAIATVTDAEAEVMPSLKIAITPVQEGSGDPSPTNIRPITGWSGANVNVCGKNLLYGTAVSGAGYYTDTGAINMYSNIKVYPNIFVKAGTYTWSCNASSAYGQYMRINELNLDGTWVRRIITEQVSGGKSGQITLEKDCLLQFAPEAGVTNCQFEVGSVATSYEASIKQTYSIPFTDGTDPIEVYGGTLDVTNGTLTVNTMMVVYDGSNDEAWERYYSGSASAFAMKINLTHDFVNSNVNIISNYLTSISSDAAWGNHDNWISSLSIGSLNTGIKSITDVATWKAYLASNPLEVCYKRIDPITYQLTPTAVQMLLGTNNLLADTGDILEGKYWSKNPLTVTRQMLNTLRDAGEITEITPEEPEENADER